MPIFRYVAFNRRGKEEKGIIDAPNAARARTLLRSKGIYVRTLEQDREKKERELFPWLTKYLYRVPRGDVGIFARQLGTLIGAGIPLDRSLANIIETTENEYLKKALIEIRAAVLEGETLSDAMQKHPAIFPMVYPNLVAVGERTGAYEDALVRLADLEASNQRLKNKVLTAAFYPLIMLGLMAAILFFLLGFVFPTIENLFQQMNAPLPLITRAVLAASDFVSSWKMLATVIIIAMGGVLFSRWRATAEGRAAWERFVLRRAIVGLVYQKVLLTRFSRNLGVMLLSGVPLIQALQVVGRLVNNSIFSAEIQTAINRIKEGARISDSFRDSTVMNQMTLGMLAAGEVSDSVPVMVEKIAQVMENDLDSSVERMSTLLEPVMIVLMGLLILLVMVAVLLPIYNLTSNLSM